MSEIVLPIKCSTVKKIDAAASKLLSIEIGSLGGLALPLWIYLYRYYGPCGDMGAIFGITLLLSTICAVVSIIVIALNINNVIPTITCINDGEI